MNTISKITKLIFLTLAFILIFGLFSVEIKDPDFWWHLKTGEYIVQTGSIPSTDPFAYTSLPKDPIKPESKRIEFILKQYWLAQVLFYKVYAYSDFQGIIFLRAFLLTILMVLIYWSVRREGIGSIASLILLVPAVIIFHTFTGERPQLFSFLFSFMIIYLLEGFRKRTFSEDLKTALDVIERSPEHFRDNMAIPQKEKSPGADFVNPRDDRNKFLNSKNLNESLRASGLLYLLPIPPIMLLWSNLHGGFILGIVIILIYLFSELIKHFLKRFGEPLATKALKALTIFGILALFFSIVNPNAYNVVPFLMEFQKSLSKTIIIESMPPLTLISSGFYEPQFIVYLAVLLLSILPLIVNMKKLDITDALLFIAFSSISLSESRFIPFFIPVALFLSARYTLKILPRYQFFERLRLMSQKISGMALYVILSVIIVIIINNADLFQKGIRQNKYPEGAVRFLKENRIQGNMFNPYVWGGYLLWSLYSDYKVFIDGRGLIPEVFFQGVRILEASPLKINGIPEWKAILNSYKVNFIVTFSVGNFNGRLVPLISAMLNDSEWHLIYMDNISLIFLRESDENQEIIKKFALPKEWLWNEVAVEAALKAKDAPNKGNYYETMGDAFFAKKSYPEAREAYSKALALMPENTRLKNQLNVLETIMRFQSHPSSQ